MNQLHPTFPLFPTLTFQIPLLPTVLMLLPLKLADSQPGHEPEDDHVHVHPGPIELELYWMIL